MSDSQSFLLDTHALLWYDSQKSLLPKPVLARIIDRGNHIFISPVSAWELSIKWKMGRLPAAAALVADFYGVLGAYGFIELPLLAPHALQAGLFETDHKDPFDRALAAQALLQNLTLISKDNLLDRFGVRRFWD